MRVFILSLFSLLIVDVVADDYWNFTGVDGRVVRAKVLGYNASSDKVQLERDNRKRFTVPVSVFREEDGPVLRNWNAAQSFMSEDALAVSVLRVSRETQQTLRPGERAAWSGYDITLENKRGTALKDIRLKVSMCQTLRFVRKEASRKVDRIAAGGSPTEAFSAAELGGRDSIVFATERLEENRVDMGTGWQEMNMTGIWIRMYLKLPDGGELMREFKEPATVWDGFIWSDEGPYHPELSKKKPEE